jgi:hypothetical protein
MGFRGLIFVEMRPMKRKDRVHFRSLQEIAGRR